MLCCDCNSKTCHLSSRITTKGSCFLGKGQNSWTRLHDNWFSLISLTAARAKVSQLETCTSATKEHKCAETWSTIILVSFLNLIYN